MQKVLAESGVGPSDIGYVEAHGTGTHAGDPTEALAIHLALANGRMDRCYMGSVKSNIGHLEAAAGIAGLIKTALSLKNKKIPPSLHFKTPNPNISFEQYRLCVPTELMDFPSTGELLYASVNSFGYGGTNANVVLQNHVENPSPSSTTPLSRILPFSAASPESLKTMVLFYDSFLQEHPGMNLSDIAYTLAYKRTHFDYRLSISACTIEELQRKLQLLGRNEIPEGCAKGKKIQKNQSLAFVYTGMGPQWWGMGRGLLHNFPDFYNTIKKCDEILYPLSGGSLIQELQKSASESCMEQPEISQVANYALQAALTDLLKTWGICPDYIIGHSIGEVAAAYAAGALTLEEGLKVSYHRSRIQALRKNQGTLLATGLSLPEAELLLSQHNNISIAAINGQHSITLSGSKPDLEEVAGHLERSEIYHRFLNVNIAYHSHQMEGLEPEVLKALHFLTPQKNIIPFFSTAYGHEYSDLLNGHYWWKNIRQPVHFASALEQIIAKQCSLFLEIGPHPVLGNYIKDALQQHQIHGHSIATLNRKKEDSISLQECIGHLYVSGYPISWSKINRPEGNFVRLPTYPWHKQSHWIESEASHQYRLSSHSYAMLARKVDTAMPTWQVEVNDHFFPWIEDHKIKGVVAFPAAAYIEAGLEICATAQETKNYGLEEILFHQLLTLQPHKEPLLQISMDVETHTFKVHSLSDALEKDWICHASGKCISTHQALPKIEIEAFKQGKCIEGQIIYKLFAEQGLDYGTQFQGIKRLWKNSGQALSEIEVACEGNYLVPPTLLDAAFQTLIGTVEQHFAEAVILPNQIDQLIYSPSPHSPVYCYAICTRQTAQQVEGNIAICDKQGNVCVQIKGLKCTLLVQNSHSEVQKLLHRPVWIEKPLKELSSIDGIWLMGMDSEAHSHHLNEAMFKRGFCSSIFSPELLSTQEKADSFVAAIPPETQVNIILGYMSKLPLNELADHEIAVVTHCVNLVKALEKLRANKPTHLKIITCNTQAIEGYPAKNTFGASLWGLGRVIRQEMKDIQCSMIDLEKDEDMTLLIEDILFSAEAEIALRQQTRYAYKIEKIQANHQSNLITKPLSSPHQAFALELKNPGSSENLYYKETSIKAPAGREVGIQVHAASLNFKDLMKILGLLNQNALEGTYFGTSFGMECSGTIVSIGHKVKKYKIGAKVCAFTPNAFQSYFVLNEDLVYPIPSNCTLDNAAIYIPFITVLHALKNIGQLKKGESILIHSACGAVGLAAIQYARYVGARIFATAGSEEKRTYLRSMNIQECSDSRSSLFVEDVLSWTEGRGVDVILNSLGGEALVKSWSLLAPYGRFLEIGKKDISLNSKLPMKHFDRNTFFASIDMDRIFAERPRFIQSLLKETRALFNKDIFKPIPCTVFPACEAMEAFQHMARAKHMGKIMLKFADQTVKGEELTSNQIAYGEATYLITGGLNGFGLMTAKWLVDKGAKHLLLLGRSGATTQEAKDTLQYLIQKGIHVYSASVDVANYDDLADTLDNFSTSIPPIKGVVHSAMVLQDAFLPQQTSESIQQVLRPKIAGCINLHLLTSKLDFFVMYSSISSLIGNPGQANYAAANAFLDAFCHFRKAQGLPATTLNWGALNTGVLSRNPKISDHLANHGIIGISPTSALNVLEKCLLDNSTQLYAINMDWKKFMDSFPVINSSFAFEDFKLDNYNSSSSFIDEVLALDEEQRHNVIIKAIIELVSKTLKMEPALIDPTVRLNKLGIDSLLTMELLAAIENETGIKVPVMDLMKGPSVEQLAQVILRLINNLHTHREIVLTPQ